MPSVVFLCVANSARSQMAEGLARASAPLGWEVYSAGSSPGAVHRHAIEALREIGIDISSQTSKGLDAVPLANANLVIPLCAEEECPVAFTSGKRLAWPLPDPASGDRDGRLARFRAVRDELARRIHRLWEAATLPT